MAQVCSRCSKANPDEAAYCYYDGAVLGGNGANGGGPVNIGAQPFPSQFVFPTGQVCRNFDQLALACQQNWKAALEVLQQGYLESFLGSMGRSDLAAAAKEAARFPDRDRGLDQFLAQLPSDAVKPPKLAVEPTEINLGQLKVGEDRTLQIDLRNQGMRLVYGSISVVDCVWLAVGEGKGGRQKLFQFGDSLTIPLRVRGKQLRASHKPLVGKLSIESNAGNVEITVRAEVPVKPYPDGVFAGAKSPRQIAEKAKEKPKEAAVLFEKGAVAKWYRENGWAYPVLGPSASGLGAVQQFFEALGLTPPPKVGINKKAIALRGPAGGKVQDVIEVKAMEKRPVYAHARCDQPWVDVSKVELNGRVATIPVVIKQIPNSPGQTLKATIAIRSNGNQRFKIPLTLQVGGGGGGAFDFTTPGVATGKETVQMQGPIVAGAPMLSLARRKPPSKKHLLPALALFLALLGVVIFDFVKPAGVGAGGGGTPIFGEGKKIDFSDFDPNPIISVSFDDRERFGITMLLEKDPRNPKEAKKLTYHPKGDTNNTCIIIDGYEYRFGEGAGTWARDTDNEFINVEPKMKNRVIKRLEVIANRKWVSRWKYPRNVYVTQTVMVVPNTDTKKLDTCLIHYTVDNKDTSPHDVGLRIMLDTYIGANDGVPFTLAGTPGLMNTKIDIQNSKDIPDFIQALENPDISNPGTVAVMVLKLPKDIRLNPGDPPLEPVSRLVISRWPGNPDVNYDYTKPFAGNEPKFWDMNDLSRGKNPDSCVAVFWDKMRMPPKTRRAMAVTYGLGKVFGIDQSGGGLGLTYRPNPTPGGEFSVTAYIRDARAGQEVNLVLPDKMSFVGKYTSTQRIASTSKLSQLSWRVQVAKDAEDGEYEIRAESGGSTAKVNVRVLPSGGGGLFEFNR